MIGWKNADNYSSMIGAMRNMSDEEKVQIFDKFQKVKFWHTSRQQLLEVKAHSHCAYFFFF